MKFPVFFRILAAINILGALLTLFSLIVMTTNRSALIDIDPHIYIQLWLIALWMLTISFMWFFASKHSYGVLMVNFIATLAIGVIIILTGWQSTEGRGSERSAIIILAIIPVIYSLFSLFGLFYKPNREWASHTNPDGMLKANRGVLISAAASLVIFIAIGFFLQSYKPNEHEVVSCQIVYARQNDASIYKGNYPFDIKPGENIDIPLTEKACFDAIKISAFGDNSRPWTSARMVNAEGPEQQLSFIQQGEYFIAKIELMCSDRVTIYIPIRQDSLVYSVGSLQLIRYYSMFEENPTDNVTMVPGGSDEEYIRAEADYGEPKISPADVPQLIAQGMTMLLREKSWNFEEIDNDEKGWVGPDGARIGLFAHGIAGLRESAVQMFSEYIGGDYIKEDYIPTILGRPLFDVSPTDEYNPAPFRRVNAETITWLASSFIPDPSTEIKIGGNPTLGKIYQESFQRVGRLLVETRQYLYYTNMKVELRKEYEEAMDDEGFHGPTWLRGKFENMLIDKYGPDYITATFDTQVPPILMGFWLRREMDGSADAIWTALQDFMLAYDEQWFKQNLEGWEASQGD